MLGVRKLVWLFLASQYSNASLELPLRILPLTNRMKTYHAVVVPNAKERLHCDENKLREIPPLSEIDGHYILSFQFFKKALREERKIPLIYSIKWGDRPGPPALHMVTPENFDNGPIMSITVEEETWNKPHQLDLDGHFTIEYAGVKAQAEVSFTFRIVESGFPVWAYNLLMDAMPDPSSQSIECAQISSLELPTFKFISNSLEFFTLSKSNYFLREQNDDICHLMVEHHESNNWIIGIAVTKTHEAFFYRDDGTPDYRFGFRPLDKPSVSTH